MKRNAAVETYYNALLNWSMSHRIDTKTYCETFGFCINHTAKMTDLYSFSTSCLCNDNCIARLNDSKMICSHCFSAAMHEQYTALASKLKWNSWLISEYVLPVEMLPIIKTPSNYFRLESFGDLINEIQVINYFNMCAKNPGVNCALWTKNPWIIEKAINSGMTEKPANLTIMGSSYYTNKPMTDYYKKFDFIDHVFTVFDPEYIKNNNIEITCGARSCKTCGRCYCGKKSAYEINEMLK